MKKWLQAVVAAGLLAGGMHTAQASWYGSSRPASFADLSSRVKSAVVNISTTKKVQRSPMNTPQSPFGGMDPFEEFRRFFEDAIPREETRHSLGSGFIINQEGDILTNNHVVGDADEIIVKLADGRKFKADVVGRDERTDLAVIKIKAKGLLPFAALGDSDAAKQGDWVMAVGNPFGFEHTVTVGVISAKGRIIGDTKAPFAKFIQTDASINPGNSGGPLFNTQGEVIGINTMIYGMGTGIGFAIPANLARNLIPQLISKGSVTRGWLGIQMQDLTPELAESYSLADEKGALVGSVFEDSPAQKAGIERGDIILEYDGQKVEAPFDLSEMVAQTPVDKKVSIRVLKKGKEEKVLTVKVGKREEGVAAAEPKAQPQEAPTDLLGLRVREMTPNEASRHKSGGGVVVERVEAGSSAESYDVREGDLLVELNDTALSSVAVYEEEIKKLKKGSWVRLLISRGPLTQFIAFRI